jgi:hypothetical protein
MSGNADVELFLMAYRERLAYHEAAPWRDRKDKAHAYAREVAPEAEAARVAYMRAIAEGRGGDGLSELERAGQAVQTGMRAACRQAAKHYTATVKPQAAPRKPRQVKGPQEPEHKLTVKGKYARLALAFDTLPPDEMLAVFGNVTADAVRHARKALSNAGFAFARGEAGSWRVTVRPSKSPSGRASLVAELQAARAKLDSLMARVSEFE